MSPRAETIAMNPARHLLAIVGLSLVVLVRYWVQLTSPIALIDEVIYVNAFRTVMAGADVGRVGGFYYPSTFAHLGAWWLARFGEPATLVALRVASVLGLVTTIWLSVCLWSGHWRWRWLVAAVYLTIAPAVRYGMATGNITFVISGSILLALMIWSVRPLTAGALLGASTAIKPLAPLSILALTLHRPFPASRKQLVAGGFGGALALALLAVNPDYLTTTPGTIGRLPFIRSIGLNRILVLLGLEVRPVVIAGVVAILLLMVARWRPMGRRTILAFGGLAAVLAVPVIWSHTLLLTLPLQVLAIELAWRRRRELRRLATVPAGSRPWHRFELTLVVLGVAALQLPDGAGAIDDQALWFQLVVLSVFYVAGPALMAYLLVTDPED